jgi:FixJ family two-component response regulator
MTTQRNVIAIVDDDPDMRSVIQDLLWRFGWHTETYASAGGFLAAASNTAAECLLVDVQLGDSNGIEMARLLGSMGYRFPTIFMTGSMNEVFRAQAAKVGCIAYLQKPFSGDELKAAIAQAIVVGTGPSGTSA